VIVVLAAVLAVPLSAQNSGGGGPALNPDIMTYFQEEMTSFMRYQSVREYNTPVYLSARIQHVEMDIQKNGLLADGGGSYYYDNNNSNYLIGGQIKINDLFYLPLFTAYAKTFMEGEPDEGTMIINNLPLFNAWAKEINESWLFGSGLFFNGETLKGGLFAGYNLKHRLIDYSGEYHHESEWWAKSYYQKEDDYTHSFKIALLPLLDTSNWRYVGKLLESVLGYAGMGDLVGIYAGEEKNTGTDSIARAMNFGLGLVFKKLRLNHMTLGPEFIYRRDNYDVAAKNDTYGAVLELKSAFGLFNFTLAPEAGYKHFYSVSKYFTSRYSDIPYFNINFTLSYAKFDKLSLKVFYQYDKISEGGFGVIFDFNEALSVLVSGRGTVKKYKTEKLDVEENTSIINTGIRYRYGGILRELLP
jgi:hypothetical protein